MGASNWRGGVNRSISRNVEVYRSTVLLHRTSTSGIRDQNIYASRDMKLKSDAEGVFFVYSVRFRSLLVFTAVTCGQQNHSTTLSRPGALISLRHHGTYSFKDKT